MKGFNEMKLEERLKLNEGEKVNFIRKYKSRYSNPRCRYFYNIIDKNGRKLGSIVYKEESHYQQRGIIYYTIKRYDINEKLVFKSRWGQSVHQKYLPNEKHLDKLSCLKKVLRSQEDSAENSQLKTKAEK